MNMVRRCLAMAVFAAAILSAGSALAATVPAQSLLAISFSDAYPRIHRGRVLGHRWRPCLHLRRRRHVEADAVPESADLGGGSLQPTAHRLPRPLTTSIRRSPPPTAGARGASSTPVFGGVPGFGGISHINDVAYLSGGRVAVGQQEGTANNGNVAVTAREIGGVWTPSFFPLYPPLADGTPVPTYASLTSIDATAGGSIAWAVGTEYSLPQNAAVKTSLIYRTIDGGVDVDPDLATGALLNEITAVTAVDADEAYATTKPPGLGSRYFLRRSPAGVWSRSALSIAAGFQANALDAYDADHLVVVGDLGKVYYTANATAAIRPGSRRQPRLDQQPLRRSDDWPRQLDRRGRQRDHRALHQRRGGSVRLVRPDGTGRCRSPRLPRASRSRSAPRISGTAATRASASRSARPDPGRTVTYWNGLHVGRGLPPVESRDRHDHLELPVQPPDSFADSLTITARATDGMSRPRVQWQSAPPCHPAPVWDGPLRRFTARRCHR